MVEDLKQPMLSEAPDAFPVPAFPPSMAKIVKQPLLRLPPDFFPVPESTLSTEEGPQWMDAQYQRFVKESRRLQAEAFEHQKSDYEYRKNESSYFLAVSIFQSSRTLSKEAGERITALGYRAVFGNYITAMEQQEPDPHALTRSFDTVFPFKRATLVISVTTKPQERKDHTWKAEAEKALRDYGHLLIERSKKKKLVKFIGIFFSGETPAAAVRISELKQEKLGPLGKVIAVRDVIGHTRYLQELMSVVN